MLLEGKYNAIIDCKKIAQEIGESELAVMICFTAMLQSRDRDKRIKFIISKETHDLWDAYNEN